MNVAIPDWQGRVSPVFDVAGAVVVAEVVNGTVQHERRVALESTTVPGRAAEMAAVGVDVLICGAVSWPLEMALQQAGIEVIPQTCGAVSHVLEAFASGGLRQDAFLMPGCCGRRRRLGRGHGRGRGRGPRCGP